MSKFPINLVLYLAIVLLLGGSGWQFYLTYTAPKSPDGNRVLKQLDEKLKDGQRRQPPSKGTDYSNMGLLSKFRDANFTGKEPPKAEVVRSVDPGPEVKTVNQTPLDEPYVREDYRGIDNFGPEVVRPGHYFLMGDHRNRSADSREWGQVPAGMIKGRAFMILFSTADATTGQRAGEVTPGSLLRKIYNLAFNSRWERFFRGIR